MILAYIIAFTLIGSVGSLVGSYFLLFKQKITESFSNYLISYAAGVLIAAAFLNILPEAAKSAGESSIFIPALLGFLSFFLAERYIRLFHYHHVHGKKPSILLVLIGDGIHNFVDGVTITAAFLTNISLGITTSLAVAAHEIPQEVADMGILLANGLSKKKAIFYNLLSALTALLGALVAFYFADIIKENLYIFLSIAAGFFIYISASDLIPDIHEETEGSKRFTTTALFLVGILTIYIFSIIFKT